ncbi:hypothetical protein OOT46_21800 [Aquabacterium sp. A7-Y]|uniref:hypothetical protein n=1 Tax=Aquabacterium sp. A7-Y TaxID=1349605 RepID=UPI00223DEB67|nr:hypothetical protein [Aquabacterium sp. A7-Y]MCW7540464.1 hypothetical protein [Aquabacterium sp. A7-Y]
MGSKIIAAIAAIAALGVAGFDVYVTYINLVEAYGSGPPYYGMTENMDKWASPVGFLLMFNAVALVLVYVLGRLAWKLWKKQPS